MSASLLKKYNIAAPRYTSYPTVPHWKSPGPNSQEWLEQVSISYAEQGVINLYIHLPYCEQMCTYCGCNKRITKNHQVERPYLDSVLTEWGMYVKALGERPVIRELHLGGGTPTFFAPENLAYLMEGILAKAQVAEDHSFSFEAHPNSTTKAHLQTLRQYGFNRISIGVQDFGQDIMLLINRKQTKKEIYRVVKESRELGYTSVNFDLIFGLPRQTINHILTNIEHLQQLRPERIAFYSYAHVPWKSPSQRAYDETDLPRGADKRALYETGKRFLEEMGYEEIGFDHFALPQDELLIAAKAKRLHRNFMGYTPHDTRLNLAFGVSGISDSWSAYVQNEKKIESYRERITKGELPLIKGYLLNSEEQIIRRHILNIMCKESTCWLHPARQCDDLYTGLERLEEMEIDGLVQIDDHCLKVLSAGRPFLRNICLAFDQYYWRDKVGVGRFSEVV
ncbi:MAG: oxygen-independent coproporphyrinogen III oxidase [Bacteroidota bacterium]